MPTVQLRDRPGLATGTGGSTSTAPIATLTLDVDQAGGLEPGYELKKNSYDLGVYIELADAVQRLRFTYPQVRAVIMTSALDRMFSAGANIGMLAQAEHAFKVNFCKFCNETLAAIEDASETGQTYIAALNGTAAGGGYELALACEKILLVDDGSATVALPEVPLLGVLPGTGGLTRLTDKRGVRRDLADVFATTAEGIRGQRAIDWRLVDEIARPTELPGGGARLAERGRRRRHRAHRTTRGGGVELPPLVRDASEDSWRYEHVLVELDRRAATATLTITGPAGAPSSMAGLREAGAAAWPLAAARELDDAISRLRFDEPVLGTWLLKTIGDPAAVLATDDLLACADDWLAREITGLWKRTLRRLEATSRSLIALIEPGSCFAGHPARGGARGGPPVHAGRRLRVRRGMAPIERARRDRARGDERRRAADGERRDQAGDQVRLSRAGRCGARGRRQGTARRRRGRARPGHGHAGRPGLGGRAQAA